MDKVALTDFIKSNIVNIPIDEQSLQIIAEQFEERTFKKDEYLLKEGKVSGYFFLSEGFLRVFTFDTDGNEVTTYFYSQNKIVFDAASFFLKRPSTENIQAMTECKVYVTNFEKLNQLFHSVAAFREFGRQIIVQEFVAYKQRTLAMINQSAEKRYLKLIETNKDVFQFAHLSHIASYLGISERTLNRIRQNFTKK
ncbi:Crp/Fnr family transcriptional regulator [Runella slithyformis]|uniref:Transcriptional regulator, Crp/Fnr family n=1 Tax=Runella slithyformis (strain ATCC 29530 / DSM 19594 / LMG 11500 / NCIMB 11436 / LSU 4) TaxID=761193 RepID=A0A7U3ZQB4_RUNSL|nr:Crp/Fnr family transcriptional regulator [Runella slithyformis]AEI51376.1 putative transcriptional regulator, Crp/Fnr family [Runella slithyformis DSM 19594]